MARFAVEANNAAKKLSTTTTDYTNASLIYFQQGLSDKEVAERTEVTIKMANAAGVSAQKVSDQMTAVWNNFDDGSKSLEYYADVMTALGAATASSTDEISQGLQKFAAVAETVGLSYEYATAALATVTAETRESADVVGTAYKTLFARIQGLQQGDTLDDGTSLNKYSAALAKVGIDIKDVNGDMKDMDVILNEMGAKWDTLAKDQQLALAQTVAGVRQYTQLVALMDNWDVFQENLNTAYTAEGSLQEQADIYAESWEAAQKRVKASMQEIYSALIPEDFIINFTSATADVLDGVGDILRGMGGFKTILLMISSIALRQFGPSLGASLQDGINKIGQLNIASNGLSGIWKSISTPQFSNIDTLASKLTMIQKSSNDVNTQMNLYNRELEKGASSATKMA
jgi:TP901 family phage tail tape measure protein